MHATQEHNMYPNDVMPLQMLRPARVDPIRTSVHLTNKILHKLIAEKSSAAHSARFSYAKQIIQVRIY